MRMTEAVVRLAEFMEKLEEESYPLTRDSIEDLLRYGKTPAGAWNRDQLEQLGVSWPLKAGWKTVLLRRRSIPCEDVRRFLALSRISAKERKRARRSGRDVLDIAHPKTS